MKKAGKASTCYSDNPKMGQPYIRGYKDGGKVESTVEDEIDEYLPKAAKDYRMPLAKPGQKLEMQKLPAKPGQKLEMQKLPYKFKDKD